MSSRFARLISRAARWSACRFLPGGVILGYHRVVAVTDDPWHLCVRPDHFSQHLEVLVRHGRPLQLRSLAAPSGSRPGRRDLAVTFDDAYIDVLEAALPVLERFEVPATVFVVTGALGTSFWWDQLVAVYRAAPPLRITVPVPSGAGTSHPDTISVDARRPVPAALHTALSSSTDSGRKRLLDDLRRGFGLPATIDPPPTARSVTSQELARLAAHPLIEIGGHTVSHPDLSRIAADRLVPEVDECRQSLGDLIGREVEAFAYPHGRISREARAAVKRAGFTIACAGHPGGVRQHTDRLALPRLWPSDVDGDGFARFLRRWTGI